MKRRKAPIVIGMCIILSSLLVLLCAYYLESITNAKLHVSHVSYGRTTEGYRFALISVTNISGRNIWFMGDTPTNPLYVYEMDQEGNRVITSGTICGVGAKPIMFPKNGTLVFRIYPPETSTDWRLGIVPNHKSARIGFFNVLWRLGLVGDDVSYEWTDPIVGPFADPSYLNAKLVPSQ